MADEIGNILIVDDNSPDGNSGLNAYYVVKAVDLSGNKSSPSNKVGEFDRSLEEACKIRRKHPLPRGRG